MNVAERVLLHACGYEVVGPAVGNSVVHIKPWYVGRTITTEITLFGRLLTEARTAALADLVADAASLGAAGVVGVELTLEERELGSRVWEVVASGTAVHSSFPFTTALSGDDLWLLHQAGYAPVRLLTGCGVHHLGRRGRLGSWAAGFDSEEMTAATAFLTDAREDALARMQNQLVGVRASGVLGVRLEMLPTPLGYGLVEVRATGAAVRLVSAAAVPAPLVVLPL